jgi:hypothetical protein
MTSRRNFQGSGMHNRDWDQNNENYGRNENRMQNRGYSNPENQDRYGDRSLYDNQRQGWGGNQYTGQSDYNPQNYRGSSSQYGHEMGRSQQRGGYSGPGSRYGNQPENVNYGNRYSQRERDNDRDFFDRAGETLRAGWNKLTGAWDNDRDYNRGGNYGPYDYGGSSYRNDYNRHRDNDRNFFERAGDRIRQGWNELTNEWTDDRDRFRQEGREYDTYNENRPTNENREYRYGPASESEYEKNLTRRRYNRNNEWDL